MTIFQSRRTIARPRKSHFCEHCHGTIPAGVSHLEEAGYWDGGFYTFRAHHDCATLWTEAFEVYGDSQDGMAQDLMEAIEPDEQRSLVQEAYNHYRGRYPHVICRLEYRWQKGDIAGRERYLSRGLEPPADDYPEIYG